MSGSAKAGTNRREAYVRTVGFLHVRIARSSVARVRRVLFPLDKDLHGGRQLGSNVLVSDWPVIYQTEDFVPDSSTLRDKEGAILSRILSDGADCVTPG
jgi:hypothetical protein